MYEQSLLLLKWKCFVCFVLFVPFQSTVKGCGHVGTVSSSHTEYNFGKLNLSGLPVLSSHPFNSN